MPFVVSGTLNGFCADTDSARNRALAAAADVASYAPSVLPGKGLAQRSFLYTGEWDYRQTDQTMFIVRGGKVVWTFSIPIKDADGAFQELGDAASMVISIRCPGRSGWLSHQVGALRRRSPPGLSPVDDSAIILGLVGVTAMRGTSRMSGPLQIARRRSSGMF